MWHIGVTLEVEASDGANTALGDVLPPSRTVALGWYGNVCGLRGCCSGVSVWTEDQPPPGSLQWEELEDEACVAEFFASSAATTQTTTPEAVPNGSFHTPVISHSRPVASHILRE